MAIAERTTGELNRHTTDDLRRDERYERTGLRRTDGHEHRLELLALCHALDGRGHE